jgi:hypothetical protein
MLAPRVNVGKSTYKKTHRFCGIGAFNASWPAAVMQYTARPRSSDRRWIQPFDNMLAMVCLPDGCNFSIGCPG